IAVRSDVGAFVEALLARMPDGPKIPFERTAPPLRELPLADGPVRHEVLMRAVQRVAIDKHDAIVITEAGNAFAWGTRALRFTNPRYRVSSGFGAMGHASTGVLGLALAHRHKAVAITGDGAMLMNNEINTAVKYRIGALW